MRKLYCPQCNLLLGMIQEDNVLEVKKGNRTIRMYTIGGPWLAVVDCPICKKGTKAELVIQGNKGI